MAQITHTRDRSDLGPRVPIFALNGPTPGLRLLVTGSDALIRALADLLWERRDLATIKGTLLLRPAGQDIALDRPDALLALDEEAEETQTALDHVIDEMAALGMLPVRVQTAA